MEANQTLTLVNYRVVSGKDFSQPTEPMVTLIPIKNLAYINAACFKRVPEMEYAIFAVYDKEKRLILKPCDANERNSIRVKSASLNNPGAKHVRCDEFMRKVMLLMGWDINSRYKVRGYVFRGDNEAVILFDLASALVLSPNSGTRQQNDGFDGESAQGSGIPLLGTFMRDTEIPTGNTEAGDDDNT